uniref:Uncharacterized protein n=1 Tax=Salix viminalis TaxID=40686 RepID=A0A6N2KQR2_SALVM
MVGFCLLKIGGDDGKKMTKILGIRVTLGDVEQLSDDKASFKLFIFVTSIDSQKESLRSINTTSLKLNPTPKRRRLTRFELPLKA